MITEVEGKGVFGETVLFQSNPKFKEPALLIKCNEQLCFTLNQQTMKELIPYFEGFIKNGNLIIEGKKYE